MVSLVISLLFTFCFSLQVSSLISLQYIHTFIPWNWSYILIPSDIILFSYQTFLSLPYSRDRQSQSRKSASSESADCAAGSGQRGDHITGLHPPPAPPPGAPAVPRVSPLRHHVHSATGRRTHPPQPGTDEGHLYTHHLTPGAWCYFLLSSFLCFPLTL